MQGHAHGGFLPSRAGQAGVGLLRHVAQRRGPEHAIGKIRELREEYWRDVKVLGAGEEINQSLEKAGRVADFFELAELMCIDALRSRTNPAAAISARSIRRRTAKRCATTSISATWRPGSMSGPDSAPELNKEPLDVRVRASVAAELQVRNGVDESSTCLAAERLARARRRAHGPLRSGRR